MPTQIDFSAIESDVLGLKVGRCNSDLFDERALYQQIIQNNYDLCRLKVPAEDEMASERLNNLGLPVFFSGSIRKYNTKIELPSPGSYNFPDLVFEVYDGSQDILLKEMLIGTWGTYPIGYYRTPYSNSLVTKEKEIECVFQYYRKFNLNKNYPDNSILFMRHQDAYVGFFALNIVNGNLESHIGGILEPYRKSGYFLDKLRYIRDICVKRQLPYFIFGARNENSEVQRIFQFVGFTPIGTDNVFHIPSLLTFSKLPPVIKQIDLTLNDRQYLSQKLFAEFRLVGGKLIAGYDRVSYQFNGANWPQNKNPLMVRFSFPVLIDREVVMVLKTENADISTAIGYYRAFKG